MNQVAAEIVTASGTTPSKFFPYGSKISSVLAGSGIEQFSAPGRWNYDDNPYVAALVNNELKSLSDPLEYNCTIRPLRLFTECGKRMYRQTLCFLLSMANQVVAPHRTLRIGQALGDGFYFYYKDGEPVEEPLRSELERTMQELAEQALPINKKIYSYHDAEQRLEALGRENSLLLLSFQNRPGVEMYACDTYRDLSYEPLLPSTGLMTRFELLSYRDTGMLLRFPRIASPREIASFVDNPVLYNIFREYKEWGQILSADCLGKMNTLCENGSIGSFIEVAESLQNKKLSQIADEIWNRRLSSGVRFILIAGPSSSGKTTFARKLSIQLRVLGLNPVPISLDDYYRNRADVPLDENVKPDLETLEALDTERLNRDMLDLIHRGETEIPQFDFTTATRKEQGKPVSISRNGIIILEGIHGLNPRLISEVPQEAVFKIYISALTQLNLDDHNRISTTDNRIIRRIVRDHYFRGMSAGETLHMWPSVHRGEKLYIFPYQNNADIAYNSALDYELAVLQPFAEPLLKTIKPSDPTYWNAVRLITFLNLFYPIPSRYVPPNSLLREFIGGLQLYH